MLRIVEKLNPKVQDEYKKRYKLDIKFISSSLVKVEDIQGQRLQYGAAMAHQDIFQQQIIINQLIKGRLRWGRGRTSHI